MDIETRIARLEAESRIRQLVARYCFAIDDRLRQDIADLFADDAVVRSRDGVMYAAGIEAIMAQYEGRFAALGPGAHYMHDVQIDFVDDDPTRATGRVAGHAELQRNGKMMVCSIRYDDSYVNTDAGWKFAERVIGFLYYVPVEEYPGILLRQDRNCAYDRSRAADFPETLPSWQAADDARTGSV